MRIRVREVAEAPDTSALRRKRISQFLIRDADCLPKENRFTGTMTDLLTAIGDKTTKPGLMIWHLNDDDNGNDDQRRFNE